MKTYQLILSHNKHYDEDPIIATKIVVCEETELVEEILKYEKERGVDREQYVTDPYVYVNLNYDPDIEFQKQFEVNQ